MTKKEEKFFNVLLFLGIAVFSAICFVTNTSNRTISFFLLLFNLESLFEIGKAHICLSRKIDGIKEQLISLNDFFIDSVNE